MEESFLNYLIGYLIVINIISLVLFGLDKRKARKNQWRIKESLLLFITLIGGGFGSILGMHLFHHKTQKNKFKFGVPLLTIISTILLLLLIAKLNL